MAASGAASREWELTMTDDGHGHAGLEQLLSRSLIETIFRRRTHRVSRGAKVVAGSMSYTPDNPPAAAVRARRGAADRDDRLHRLSPCPIGRFADPRDGTPIMAKPNVNMAGRTAGSPDNAQGTHFFLINDTGTYFSAQAAAARRRGPALRCADADRACRAGESEASRPSHRRAGRARFSRLSRFEPLPVQPAGNDHSLPGRRSLAPIHQRHDVSAHPAGGRAAHHRRRPQFLSPGRRQQMGEERLPQQGPQAAARRRSGPCARRSKPI